MDGMPECFILLLEIIAVVIMIINERDSADNNWSLNVIQVLSSVGHSSWVDYAIVEYYIIIQASESFLEIDAEVFCNVFFNQVVRMIHFHLFSMASRTVIG